MKPRLSKRAAQTGVGALALAALIGVAWFVQSRSDRQSDGEAIESHGAHRSDSIASATEAASRGEVTVDAATIERLGVAFAPVRREPIADGARHVATVTPDEGRISHVHARVSGWVEELYVDTTGETVQRGQAVAAIFSQELFASQTEYLAIRNRSGESPNSAVLEAARVRLAVLGMSEVEIGALEAEGTARRLVTVAAPRDGIVLRRGVSVGTAIDPSVELMTIVDLSSVWVLTEVPESVAVDVRVGAKATLELPGTGRQPLATTVDFIYPTLTERTRSVRVRFVVPNAEGALRPGMYGTASFAATGDAALTIPRDAVIETGDSRHVFVKTPAGALEPRQVRLGRRRPDRLEVLEGLAVGEEVVSSGVFLIDSESRLRASSAGPSHAGHAPHP